MIYVKEQKGKIHVLGRILSLYYFILVPSKGFNLSIYPFVQTFIYEVAFYTKNYVKYSNHPTANPCIREMMSLLQTYLQLWETNIRTRIFFIHYISNK